MQPSKVGTTNFEFDLPNNEPNFWEIFFSKNVLNKERASLCCLGQKVVYKKSKKWKMTKMSFRGLLSPEPADWNWFSLTLSLPRFLSPLRWLSWLKLLRFGGKVQFWQLDFLPWVPEVWSRSSLAELTKALHKRDLQWCVRLTMVSKGSISL